MNKRYFVIVQFFDRNGCEEPPYLVELKEPIIEGEDGISQFENSYNHGFYLWEGDLYLEDMGQLDNRGILEEEELEDNLITYAFSANDAILRDQGDNNIVIYLDTYIEI